MVLTSKLKKYGLLAASISVFTLGVGTTSLIGCGGSHSSSSASTSGLPNGSATLTQVAQGRTIVLQFGCADCHSGDPGRTSPASPTWLAGFLAVGGKQGSFQLGPTTTVYAANLTPDTTGLGSVSDQKVFNALKFGLDPHDPVNPDSPISAAPANAHYLAPVMPWQSIRLHTDSDIWAIVAYLKHGIKATSNVPPANVGDGAAVGFWAGTVAPEPGAYPLSNEVFKP